MLPTLATANTVVRWLPPADPDVEGYVVYLGAPGQPLDQAFDIGFVAPDGTGHASFDIATLVGPGVYALAMTAYDGGGLESELSNVVFANIEVPSAPDCVVDADCANADRCDGIETCVAGICQAGTELTCEAAGPCRQAFCDPLSGCGMSALSDGTICDDADSGTRDDVCRAGVCVGMPVQTDACAEATGPAHAIRLSLHEDAPGLVVAWDAPAHPAGSVLRYRAPDGTFHQLEGTVFRTREGCQAEYRVVLMLEPRTSYTYQVTGRSSRGPVWSGVEWFRTPPAPKLKGIFGTTFVAGVGLAENPGSPNARRVLDLVRSSVSTQLLLGGGGYAAAGARLYGEPVREGDPVARFFDQLSPVSSRVVFLPTMDPNEPMEEYTGRLHLPDGDSASHGSYSLDYARTHYVSLNTADRSGITVDAPESQAHLAWLRNDLEAARQRGVRWIVVFTKMDFVSSELSPPSNADLAPGLQAIFEEYDVDVVLSGEGVSYERSFPLRAGKPTSLDPRRGDAGSGVVYVRAGSGGRSDFGSFAGSTPPAWSALRDNKYAVIVRIFELGNRLLIRAYGLPPGGAYEPEILDSYVIR